MMLWQASLLTSLYSPTDTPILRWMSSRTVTARCSLGGGSPGTTYAYDPQDSLVQPVTLSLPSRPTRALSRL